MTDTATAHQNTQRLRSIAEHWNRRAAGQQLKRGSAKYQKAMLEFALGAHSALIACGHGGLPEMLLVFISMGRDINDFVKDAS